MPNLDWRKDVIPAVGKKIKEILASSGKSMTRPQAMKQAWKDPAILKLIKQYKDQASLRAKAHSTSSVTRKRRVVRKRRVTKRKVGGARHRKRTRRTKKSTKTVRKRRVVRRRRRTAK